MVKEKIEQKSKIVDLSEKDWLDLFHYPTLILGTLKPPVLDTYVSKVLKQRNDRFVIFLSEKASQYEAITKNDSIYLLNFNQKGAVLPFLLNLFSGNIEQAVHRISSLFLTTVLINKRYHSEYKRVFVNAITVIKTLFGEKATLDHLTKLLDNTEGKGVKLVLQFSRLNKMSQDRHSIHIVNWFMNDYYDKKAKSFDKTLDVRIFVNQLNNTVGRKENVIYL